MRLEELKVSDLTDEKMQWVYDLIKEAYASGTQEVTVPSEALTVAQFNYLQDLGYTVSSNYTEDTISGW